MARFVFLHNTIGVPPAIARPPHGHAIDVVDQYDLTAAVLGGADGLLLGQHLDERHLAEHVALLDGYLDAGGTIALNGPVARPFLSGLQAHCPVPQAKREDWLIDMAEPHPVTAGVAADDLAFRNGVVGFWARGAIPAPEGAIVLTRLRRTGWPADFIWPRPHGGRVFVHPGNDVWGYAGDETTAALVFPQLLDWIAAAP